MLKIFFCWVLKKSSQLTQVQTQCRYLKLNKMDLMPCNKTSNWAGMDSKIYLVKLPNPSYYCFVFDVDHGWRLILFHWLNFCWAVQSSPYSLWSMWFCRSVSHLSFTCFSNWRVWGWSVVNLYSSKKVLSLLAISCPTCSYMCSIFNLLFLKKHWPV